jgi:hypothetical protein
MPPPGACSEWVVYRLNSNSSSATRAFLGPTLLPTLRQGFTGALFHMCGAVQFHWRRGKTAQPRIQGIFLPGILPDHLRGLHNSILIHSFQAIWSSRPASESSYGSLVLGVDAAGMGAVCTAIVFRRGHHIARVETPYGFDTVDTAGRVEQIIRHEQRHG